jgi:hypothetical protein
VGDAGGETIRPVIDQHAIVGLVRKRRAGGGLKGRRAPGFGQAVGEQEVGYAAILGFGLGSPFDVPAEIGRPSLEDREIVGF